MASVMVTPTSSLTDSQVDGIVKMVTASVERLNEKNVTILDNKGNVVKSLTNAEISTTVPSEPSAAVRERVNNARKFANERLKGSGVFCNAKMTPAQIRDFCASNLTESAVATLSGAFERMGLSARGYDRILKVARTIADLAGSKEIDAPHVAEAVQLRSLDRNYW